MPILCFGERVIDLHSHIIPGLDDGSATLEDARELAAAAVAAGVVTLAATPHVRHDYPTTPQQMAAGVAAVQAELAEVGIPLELLHGGEIDLVRLPLLTSDDVRRFTLGGAGRYLLVEFPYDGWPASLEFAINGLRNDGITPVIAHPERNDAVQGRPERLAAAVDAGALVQVTTGSLSGLLGRRAKATAKRLLRLDLVHLLASDVHRADSRVLGAAAASAALRDHGLVRHLTEDVPGAIAAGEPVPSGPERPRRGILSLRARRR